MKWKVRVPVSKRHTHVPPETESGIRNCKMKSVRHRNYWLLYERRNENKVLAARYDVMRRESGQDERGLWCSGVRERMRGEADSCLIWKVFREMIWGEKLSGSGVVLSKEQTQTHAGLKPDSVATRRFPPSAPSPSKTIAWLLRWVQHLGSDGKRELEIRYRFRGWYSSKSERIACSELSISSRMMMIVMQVLSMQTRLVSHYPSGIEHLAKSQQLEYIH